MTRALRDVKTHQSAILSGLATSVVLRRSEATNASVQRKVMNAAAEIPRVVIMGLTTAKLKESLACQNQSSSSLPTTGWVHTFWNRNRHDQ
jgi:hypothetical protein